MMNSKMRMTSRHHARGFTLIEVMVVVVILGILASVVVLNIQDSPDQAKVTKAKADIASIESALDLYRLDNHKYPSTDEGLEILSQKTGKMNKVYLKKLTKDPWDNAYQYMNPGVHGSIDIYSFGRDGAEGGEGVDADIGNWVADE